MASKAPNFKLQDQDGNWHALEDYQGRWLVLYFYPKDDTPGCTTEACSFRDERSTIAELGNVDVVGVSLDSVASHKQFADKHHLNYTLLSDPEHSVIAAYHSWRPHWYLGKSGIRTERNTFIISPKGQIVKKYRGVNPNDHAKTIITDLKQLSVASLDSTEN